MRGARGKFPRTRRVVPQITMTPTVPLTADAEALADHDAALLADWWGLAIELLTRFGDGYDRRQTPGVPPGVARGVRGGGGRPQPGRAAAEGQGVDAAGQAGHGESAAVKMF